MRAFSVCRPITQNEITVSSLVWMNELSFVWKLCR